MTADFEQPAGLDDLARVAAALAQAKADLERIERILKGFVKGVCHRMSLKRHDDEWYRIAGESRVKDHVGVMRALKEKGANLDDIWQVDDIVGARAVVVRLKDVDDLVRHIVCDKAMPLDGVNLLPRHDDTGYRAVHVKGHLENEGRLVGCEIQVRTALQDAWAVVSRSDLYGQREMPAAIRRAARIQADHLAAIDQAFELNQYMIRDYAQLTPVAKEKAAAEGAPDELPA